MVTIYGIPNCDTVKKARKWLDDQGIDFQFHDLRQQGLDPQQAKAWIEELGWENVVNKRSTTWKQLDEKQRTTMNASAAVKAIVAQPTLVKRPLLDTGKNRYTGFSTAQYADIFA